MKQSEIKVVEPHEYVIEDGGVTDGWHKIVLVRPRHILEQLGTKARRLHLAFSPLQNRMAVNYDHRKLTGHEAAAVLLWFRERAKE